MKLTFLGCFVACLMCITASVAQPTNGNFAVNSGNNDFSWCPWDTWGTFSDGSTPNWWRTHGTPCFPVAEIHYCTEDPSRLGMYMGGNTWVTGEFHGEGVAAGFQFKAGVTYDVTVDVCMHDFTTSFESLVLKATTSLPRNLTMPGCDQTLPTNTGVWQSIKDFTISSSPAIVLGSNTATFTPTADYNYIWIYPYVVDNSIDWNALVTITNVSIKPTCLDAITFTGQPTYNTYNWYKHIYFGASSTLFSTNPSVSNEFWADKSIVLNPKFQSVVSPGTGKGYDLFAIAKYPCGTLSAVGPDNTTANLDPSAFMSDGKLPNSPLSQKDVSGVKSSTELYPNPAHDAIHVSGFDNSEYLVSDMMGRAILQGTLSEGKINVSDLAAGNYILTIIKENHQKEHFKFVKQ